jgi:hypothetical protein
MSRHVTEFIEGLASFRTSNLSQLKADILKYYDADLDTKKYRRNIYCLMLEQHEIRKFSPLLLGRGM